jgi:hypothetical protein
MQAAGDDQAVVRWQHGVAGEDVGLGVRVRTDRCYPYLSWIIHKPHSNALKRISHVKDDLRKQTCDFCAPTSFGLFVSLPTKRRFMLF